MSSLEFHNGLTESRVMYNSQFNLNIYPDWHSKGTCRNAEAVLVRLQYKKDFKIFFICFYFFL